MATPPFAPGFEASLKVPPQGGLLELLAGHIVYPQFFCCISGNSVRVDKAPVALIRSAITCACTGAAVCIDILGSWAQLPETLATYSVDFDDGNVVPGAWPPGGDICHPLGGYAATGVYEVTLTVTDTLAPVAATDIDILEVVVAICPPAPPSPCQELP